MEVNFDFWQGVTEINAANAMPLFQFEESGSGWAEGFGYSIRMESKDYLYSGNANANGFG